MYLAPNALSSLYPQMHTIGYITTYNVHICGGGEPQGLVGNGWYACSLITDSSGDYKPSIGKQMAMLLDLFRKSPKLWGVGWGGRGTSEESARLILMFTMHVPWLSKCYEWVPRTANRHNIA